MSEYIPETGEIILLTNNKKTKQIYIQIVKLAIMNGNIFLILIDRMEIKYVLEHTFIIEK